jgi:hypothetical protein
MKKLLFAAILLMSISAFGQINLSAYSSMYARIEVDEGWAATDLFQLHFHSEAWLIEEKEAYYRSRPGFQANLVFNTNGHGLQALALLDWFKAKTRITAYFKMWGQTARARCRVIAITHQNGIVNVKITGLETFKFE